MIIHKILFCIVIVYSIELSSAGKKEDRATKKEYPEGSITRFKDYTLHFIYRLKTKLKIETDAKEETDLETFSSTKLTLSGKEPIMPGDSNYESKNEKFQYLAIKLFKVYSDLLPTKKELVEDKFESINDSLIRLEYRLGFKTVIPLNLGAAIKAFREKLCEVAGENAKNIINKSLKALNAMQDETKLDEHAVAVAAAAYAITKLQEEEAAKKLKPQDSKKESGLSGRKLLPSLSKKDSDLSGRKLLPSLSKKDSDLSGRKLLPSLSKKNSDLSGRKLLPSLSKKDSDLSGRKLESTDSKKKMVANPSESETHVIPNSSANTAAVEYHSGNSEDNPESVVTMPNWSTAAD